MIEDLKYKNIEKYKRELIHYYIILMSVVLFMFAMIFVFFIHDTIMSWYIIGGLLLLVYSYFLIRKSYSINSLIHIYMICGSIYNFYILLAFWDNSVVSFVWFLPIPLAAYVFFSRKFVLIYSLFVIILIVSGYYISKHFSFNFQHHSKDDVKFTDTIVIISNTAIISLILYFKDKIKREEILKEIKAPESEVPKNIVEKDLHFAEDLFKRIENQMQTKQPFKDINYNISKLSAELEINSSYISKAIRHYGYPNFNNYLNLYRINYVKKLLNESNLEKVTLMYIYTEAGFSNQSTFNRVFKQIEKITPSEYISNLSKK